jgi:beta-lactamase regulating signal transducer with metallopeptidase domain
MATISPTIFTFLLNALWQIPLIAAVAVGICWVMRNGPAVHRHAVWVVALFAAVALPLASMRTSELTPTTPIDLLLWAQPFNQTSTARLATVPAVAPHTSSGSTRTIPLAETTMRVAVWVYLLFLLYRVGKLGWAWVQTLQIRRSAHPIGAMTPALKEAWAHCLQTFSLNRVELLSSPSISSPLAMGVWRKTIILPECMTGESSREVLDAALGHEMAHFVRHDFGLNFLYEALSVPVVFHPAVWLIRRGIAQTREMACDDLITHRLLDANRYARAIVQIATTMSRVANPGYLLGVFAGDNLEERIQRLVQRTPANVNQARVLLASGLAVIAACVIIASGLSLTARAQGASYGEMKLAQDAYNGGDFRAAIQHFENAVNLEPSNSRPKLFLANALLREFAAEKNEADPSLQTRAQAQYASVLATEPQNAVAIRGMMQLAVDTKQVSQAREWAARLIQTDPTSTAGYYTAGVMTWATIFPEVQRAIQASGGKLQDYTILDPRIRLELREKYLPQLDEGFRYLQGALRIDPKLDDAMAYINLLYRLKASLVDNPAEVSSAIAEADKWVGLALATKRERSSVPTSQPAQLNVDGPPPGPVPPGRMIPAPPPPPPPPGVAQNASPLPFTRVRNGEQPSPFWQVSGKTEMPAFDLFHSLEAKGFRAAMIRSGEDHLVRVMVGPYPDQQSLAHAKSEIESAGFVALRVW